MKYCPNCEAGYPDSTTNCPQHGALLEKLSELRLGMSILGKYRIERKLISGGMGALYAARRHDQNKKCVLKLISPEHAKEDEYIERFKKEAQIHYKLDHKNVVRCGDLETAEDGAFFFSMEFVETQSGYQSPDLWGFLEKKGPLDVLEAISIARAIAKGLHAVHRQKVVHRDLKPENILMAWDGERWVPKITDFGIAAADASNVQGARAVTSASLLSPPYAAPEQWLGRRSADLDGRTDIYALGITFFRMLTGRNPFYGDSRESWSVQHQTAAPPKPSQLRAEVARWHGLDQLVMGMLSKDSADRPHAKRVIEQLNAVEQRKRVPSQDIRITQPILEKTQLEPAVNPIGKAEFSRGNTRRTSRRAKPKRNFRKLFTAIIGAACFASTVTWLVPEPQISFSGPAPLFLMPPSTPIGRGRPCQLVFEENCLMYIQYLNNGNAPALDARGKINLAIRPSDDIPPQLDTKHFVGIHPNTIDPQTGSTQDEGLASILDARNPSASLARLRDTLSTGSARLYAYGGMNYRNTFRIQQIKSFCYYLEADLQQWHRCESRD